jgi:hypothetical protein
VLIRVAKVSEDARLRTGRHEINVGRDTGLSSLGELRAPTLLTRRSRVKNLTG